MPTAPLVLFVYNRPHHTLKCLKAIESCQMQEETTLYIFADGIKDFATEHEIQEIKKVREFLSCRKWCGDVIIQESTKNKGLATSIYEGVTKVINHHGKAIVLEDDIIISKWFLVYMNEALNLYEKEEKVYSISGFSIKNNLVGQDTFFLPISTSWGWATWKRAWDKFEPDIYELLSKTDETMNFGGYPYYQMLINESQKKIDSWAIKWYASIFLNKGINLWPDVSLIENIGFDQSGTHTKDRVFGERSVTNQKVKVNYIPPSLDPVIIELYKGEFTNQHKSKETGLLKKLLKLFR